MITVRRIFAAASLALCMTAFNACVKEAAPEQLPVADENLVEITFDALSVGLKSTFDGDARKINWELTDKVAVEDISHIFYIEFSNHLVADSIAEATGVKTALFHSCHNVTRQELESGVTYLSLMRGNLETLKETMK